MQFTTFLTFLVLAVTGALAAPLRMCGTQPYYIDQVPPRLPPPQSRLHPQLMRGLSTPATRRTTTCCARSWAAGSTSRAASPASTRRTTPASVASSGPLASAMARFSTRTRYVSHPSAEHRLSPADGPKNSTSVSTTSSAPSTSRTSAEPPATASASTGARTASWSISRLLRTA